MDQQPLHNTIENIYFTVPGSLPGEHWQSMFAAVDEFIPLRGAWVGHSEWWLHEEYREGYQEFYKLPDDFAASYFSVATESEEGATGDPMVIKSVMGEDDNALRLSEVLPDREIRMATDAYLQWGKKFSIGDAIIFHDVFPGTQASIFIAFYRSEVMDDFTDDDFQQLTLLKQHMMAAHRLSLLDVARRVDAQQVGGYLMVVDHLGLVHHMEAGMRELIQSKSSGFIDNRLPESLVNCIGAEKNSWENISLDIEPVGKKGFLLVRLRDAGEPLTAMERKVETLLRQGLTIKQIANELSIAASTASSYSKKVYAKLGVSGKHELVGN